MRDWSQHVAENIRQAREGSGQSQQQVVDRFNVLFQAGWARETLAKIEAHRRKRGRAATLDEVLRLAVVLGVSLRDLLEPSGDVHIGGQAAASFGFVGGLLQGHEPVSEKSAAPPAGAHEDWRWLDTVRPSDGPAITVTPDAARAVSRLVARHRDELDAFEQRIRQLANDNPGAEA